MLIQVGIALEDFFFFLFKVFSHTRWLREHGIMINWLDLTESSMTWRMWMRRYMINNKIYFVLYPVLMGTFVIRSWEGVRLYPLTQWSLHRSWKNDKGSCRAMIGEVLKRAWWSEVGILREVLAADKSLNRNLERGESLGSHCKEMPRVKGSGEIEKTMQMSHKPARKNQTTSCVCLSVHLQARGSWISDAHPHDIT